MSIPGFESLVNKNPKPKPKKNRDLIPGINFGRMFRRGKKQKLQYAASNRAKRIGGKGFTGRESSGVPSVGFGGSNKVTGGATSGYGGSAPKKENLPKKTTKLVDAEKGFIQRKGADYRSGNPRGFIQRKGGGVPSVGFGGSTPKTSPKNKLGKDENNAMAIKAKQMNAQIKKDQAPIKKKASDFKTLMERWNYENDNANPKGGRSDYGSGWTVKNVNKRNEVRKMAGKSKTRKGMAK
jgi:hypothetical protein